MERFVFVLFFCNFVILPGLAQTDGYHPFVEEGKTWWMRHNAPDNPHWPTPFDFSYTISGDTLIGDANYKKLWAYNERNSGLTEYKMALREEDKTVFFVPKGSTEHYVLYDFNCIVGQTVTVSNTTNPATWVCNIEVFEEMTTNLGGIERKAFKVRRMIPNEDEEDPEYTLMKYWWVEGIGGEWGPLVNSYIGIYGNPENFKRCELNGEIIFDISWLHAATNVDFNPCNTSDNDASLPLFDLQGRRISGQPKAGVYVRNGRKVVVR